MANILSTRDLLGQDYREILVWHHRMNHCSLKFLLIISKRGLIPRKIINIRKLPPCVTFLFVKSHKRPWRTKGKLSGRSISNPLETRPGSMTSIYQMVSSQPRLISQVTGDITHTRF